MRRRQVYFGEQTCAEMMAGLSRVCYDSILISSRPEIYQVILKLVKISSEASPRTS